MTCRCRCDPDFYGDPFLSPRQTNPTAGTPEDADEAHS